MIELPLPLVRPVLHPPSSSSAFELPSSSSSSSSPQGLPAPLPVASVAAPPAPPEPTLADADAETDADAEADADADADADVDPPPPPPSPGSTSSQSMPQVSTQLCASRQAMRAVAVALAGSQFGKQLPQPLVSSAQARDSAQHPSMHALQLGVSETNPQPAAAPPQTTSSEQAVVQLSQGQARIASYSAAPVGKLATQASTQAVSAQPCWHD